MANLVALSMEQALHLYNQMIDFKIPQIQIDEGLSRVDQKVLSETLFVIPHNDGEAQRAVEILRALKAPHLRVSTQAWGATLDKEGLSPNEVIELKKAGLKHVVIFEIPSEKAERELQELGLQVTIIDHHAYQGLDRRRRESSLEQIAQILNWPMSQVDLAIAVNDRGYIPGLKSLGLSMEEIRQIRTYDLLAQGNTLEHIEYATRSAQEQIPRFAKQAGVVMVTEPVVDDGILKQELALNSPTGLASVLIINNSRVSFSGDPAVNEALLGINFELLGYTAGTFAKYGGGDPKASMFFGFRPKEPPKGARVLVPPSVAERIRETVAQARLEGGHR